MNTYSFIKNLCPFYIYIKICFSIHLHRVRFLLICLLLNGFTFLANATSGLSSVEIDFNVNKVLAIFGLPSAQTPKSYIFRLENNKGIRTEVTDNETDNNFQKFINFISNSHVGNESIFPLMNVNILSHSPKLSQAYHTVINNWVDKMVSDFQRVNPNTPRNSNSITEAVKWAYNNNQDIGIFFYRIFISNTLIDSSYAAFGKNINFDYFFNRFDEFSIAVFDHIFRTKINVFLDLINSEDKHKHNGAERIEAIEKATNFYIQNAFFAVLGYESIWWEDLARVLPKDQIKSIGIHYSKFLNDFEFSKFSHPEFITIVRNISTFFMIYGESFQGSFDTVINNMIEFDITLYDTALDFVKLAPESQRLELYLKLLRALYDKPLYRLNQDRVDKLREVLEESYASDERVKDYLVLINAHSNRVFIIENYESIFHYVKRALPKFSSSDNIHPGQCSSLF